jgi:hypothetical protein
VRAEFYGVVHVIPLWRIKGTQMNGRLGGEIKRNKGEKNKNIAASKVCK